MKPGDLVMPLHERPDGDRASILWQRPWTETDADDHCFDCTGVMLVVAMVRSTNVRHAEVIDMLVLTSDRRLGWTLKNEVRT